MLEVMELYSDKKAWVSMKIEVDSERRALDVYFCRLGILDPLNSSIINQ